MPQSDAAFSKYGRMSVQNILNFDAKMYRLQTLETKLETVEQPEDSAKVIYQCYGKVEFQSVSDLRKGVICVVSL